MATTIELTPQQVQQLFPEQPPKKNVVSVSFEANTIAELKAQMIAFIKGNDNAPVPTLNDVVNLKGISGNKT